MKLFGMELNKVFCRLSALLMLFLALFVNFALLYSSPQTYGIEPESYQKAYDYLSRMDANSAYEFLEQYESSLYEEDEQDLMFSQSTMQETMLVSQLKKQIKNVKDYPAYLAEIQDEAKRSSVSIFQSASEYSKKDAQKTAEDFVVLEGTEPGITASMSFEEAVEFSATDILVLLMMVLIVTSLVVSEKQKDMFKLLRSTKNGRLGLIASKLGVVLISAFGCALIFWAENFLTAQFKYGWLDWNMPIQSIEGFTACGLPVSILQYSILLILAKGAAYFLFGTFVLWIALKASNAIMIYLWTLIFLGAELLFYERIDGSSTWALLHYLNLIALIRVNPVLGYYFNLNLFGVPVNIIPLSFTTEILITALLCFGCIHVFCSPNWNSQLKTISWKRKKNREVKVPAASLWLHELYRLMITNYGLMILIILAFCQYWLYAGKTEYLLDDQYYCKTFIQEIQGPVTEQTDEYFENKEQMFQQAIDQQALAPLQYKAELITKEKYEALLNITSQTLRPYSGFLMAKDQYLYAKENGVVLLDTNGWQRLYGYGNSGTTTDLMLALILLLGLIILFSQYGSQPSETGMDKLTKTTIYGRKKIFRIQMVLCLAYAAAAFIICYLPDLLFVIHNYGLPFVQASLDSLPVKAGSLFGSMPLWGYTLLLYGLRLVSVMAASMFILWLSRKLKTTTKTLAVSFLIFAFPLAISLLGVTFMNWFSLNPLFSGNLLLNLF